MPYCHKCGVQLPEEAVFCPNCGAAITPRREGVQSEWGGKLALACYFALAGGILMDSLIVGLVLFSMGVDYLDLPFPFALISLPVNETIILGVTLLFVRYKSVDLKKLGFKKASPRILAIVSIAAVPLLFLASGISIGETIIFGPDPMEELLVESLMPRDSFQLVVMIVLSLVLVGPCEELAFRGFVQKGFENSFGKIKGLLIASTLFGLLHGLNSLRAIVPVSAISLVLGYVWQRTGGNTTASALMHGIYDSIGIAIAYFTSI